MSSNKEGLPPGVKFENTYLNCHKGPGYSVPSISETKQPEAKKTKQIRTGFEEDEDDAPETTLNLTNTSMPNAKSESPKKTLESTKFSFIKGKPAAPVVQPPKKEE
jgi:hypothetical protein